MKGKKLTKRKAKPITPHGDTVAWMVLRRAQYHLLMRHSIFVERKYVFAELADEHAYNILGGLAFAVNRGNLRRVADA